jgi:peptide deformylase
MATLDILHYPHSVLRKKSEPIKNIDEAIIAFARDMVETMYAGRGVGLAAPQVGISKNLIVIDIGEGAIAVINPEITLAEGQAIMEEGCLCLPKLTVEVPRHEKVQVKGVDLNGKPVVFDAEELLARVLQHEIDHLHGALIIDKLSKVKRDLALKQYKKLKAE